MGRRGRRSPGLPWGGLLLTVLLAACAAEPVAQQAAGPSAPVEARASVDKAVATTGDLLTYTVTVEHDSEIEVLLPEPGARIAGFRIVELGREEPVRRGGRVIEERWYQLRADLVGSYVLPPVSIAYRRVDAPTTAGAASEGAVGEATDGESGAGDGGYQTIQTSAIFVEVASVLPEDGVAEDIRDVKPLRRIQRPVPWPWIGLGAALLLGLALFFWLRRRRQAPAAPPRPAHEVAFDALRRLRETDFEDPEAVRLFHFEISEVMRTYVEARFGLNATDLTTEEIQLALCESAEPGIDEKRGLTHFLKATDRVKFAAHEPTEDEIQGTYEQALSFVEATVPPPSENHDDPEQEAA